MSRPTKVNAGTVRAIVALGAVLVLQDAADAQVEGRAAAAEPAPIEEVVVLGKELEELRIRIVRAENDAYARFNEINSDDRFDIHCYERAPENSRVQTRTCLSNAWRDGDAAAGNAVVRGLQSGGTVAGGSSGSTSTGGGGAGFSGVPAQYSAQQLRQKDLAFEELARLAEQDAVLKEAMQRVGQAYLALENASGSRPESTLSREVAASEQALPPGARRRFDVRIGADAWSHPLGARGFTIAGMDGEIRDLLVECEKKETRLEYVADVDWTIPEAWGACTIRVSAKRGTTFALLELE